MTKLKKEGLEERIEKSTSNILAQFEEYKPPEEIILDGKGLNESEIYLFKEALEEKLNSKKYKIKVILDGQKEGYVIDVKSYLNMKCFNN